MSGYDRGMFREQPEPAPVLIVAFGSSVFGMHPRTTNEALSAGQAVGG